MYIYKITNKINQKIYIGKTIKSVEERWKEHCYNAKNQIIDTKFYRAINKYGIESFTIETIDTADSEDLLNLKECYWIKYYNSISDGYNSTDGGEGGNTYKYKTKEELEIIKEKIKESKLGDKNPNSRKIKCKNIVSKQELIFNTVNECMLFFGEKNHNFITRRCCHSTKYLFRGEWLIAYYEDDYIEDYTLEKNNRKAKRILVENLETKEIKEFSSYASAERYYGLKNKTISGHAYKKGKDFIIKDKYHIIVL